MQLAVGSTVAMFDCSQRLFIKREDIDPQISNGNEARNKVQTSPTKISGKSINGYYIKIN
jgi:hypothetical protein